MRYEIKGTYVVEAETKEEARRIGEDITGIETNEVSEEGEFPVSSRPVNEPIEIGEDGKDLIRSVCEMRSRDVRSAKCILSKLDIRQIADGQFPVIGNAKLKALQIIVNALERRSQDE